MNAALPRFLKSAYRKEPLPAFLITVGIVDAALGGFGDRGQLLIFGLGTIGVAIGLRWLMLSQRSIPPAEPVVRYLPPASSRPALPVLMAAKKKPPQH